MKVCVVGCGAVGSLFAAGLAQLDDVEVWAYDLDEAHVRAINEGGLRISGAGELEARLQATADASELPPCDFGIVATKSMHTGAAMAAVAASAVVLARPASTVRLLSLAVALMVLVDPLLVWSVGWWLSVGATSGIALLGAPLAARLPGPRPLAEALGVTDPG